MLLSVLLLAGCGAPQGDESTAVSTQAVGTVVTQQSPTVLSIQARAAAPRALSMQATLAPRIAPKPRKKAANKNVQTGVASWYGRRFHGRKTASGERYDMRAMTAAHRTLPFGTRVRVSVGDRSVEVCINDRGPFSGRRIIDLSKAAAKELDMVKAGLKQVRLEVLGRKGRRCRQ